MYRYQYMAQYDNAILFNLHTSNSNKIYWCLATRDNEGIIENFKSLRKAEIIDEFHYLYIDSEQLSRIVKDVCAVEADGHEIILIDFDQFKRYVEEGKSILSVVCHNFLNSIKEQNK